MLKIFSSFCFQGRWCWRLQEEGSDREVHGGAWWDVPAADGGSCSWERSLPCLSVAGALPTNAVAPDWRSDGGVHWRAGGCGGRCWHGPRQGHHRALEGHDKRYYWDFTVSATSFQILFSGFVHAFLFIYAMFGMWFDTLLWHKMLLFVVVHFRFRYWTIDHHRMNARSWSTSSIFYFVFDCVFSSQLLWLTQSSTAKAEVSRLDSGEESNGRCRSELRCLSSSCPSSHHVAAVPNTTAMEITPCLVGIVTRNLLQHTLTLFLMNRNQQYYREPVIYVPFFKHISYASSSVAILRLQKCHVLKIFFVWAPMQRTW